MNSAIANGQTMIRRFLCDFHPATMTPFMRELEPRPREEMIKYAIYSDFFPTSIGAVPSSSVANMTMSAPMMDAGTVAVEQTSVVASAAKSAYVPPHLRKGGANTAVVPEHHATPAPAPAAPSAYVPPHLRRKPDGSGSGPVKKINTASVVVGPDGKKKEEFPALGGAGAAKPKKSAWSKETSFATITAAPAPEEAPEMETQATILMRENERLRQMMIAQTRQREIAKFDTMAVRENGGVAYGGGESDEEYGGRGGGGGSDDEGAYDDEDAENDKYYA